MRFMTVGGAAPPRAMIEAFGERHGLHIVHGWGMTEMCPIGTLSGAPGQEQGLTGGARYDKRAQQGPPIPFVEIRARGEDGLVPWDGESMGELEVRGPSIASAYYESPDSGDRWTDDGWFRTGDIVTIGQRRLRRGAGPRQGPRQVGRRVDLHRRARERADGAPGRRRGGGDRGARREVVGAAARGGRAAVRAPRRPATSSATSSRRASPSSGSPSGTSSSTRSRRPRSGSSARPRCGRCSRPAVAGRETLERPHGNLHHHRAARRGRARHDRQPADERALGSPSSRSSKTEIDALDGDGGRPRDRAPGRGRASVRRRRGHQGVPLAARGAVRGKLGARDPEARAPDGRGAHAVRGGDPRLLPGRRARARDVLRHPHLRRRRDARASRRSSSG